MDFSWDRMFEALDHPYRRRVLVGLLDHPDGLDAHTSEDGIRSATDGGIGQDTFDREAALHHLPKLERLGYVRWDRETDSLRRGPEWAEIEPLLRLVDDHQDDLPDGWV